LEFIVGTRASESDVSIVVIFSRTAAVTGCCSIDLNKVTNILEFTYEVRYGCIKTKRENDQNQGRQMIATGILRIK